MLRTVALLSATLALALPASAFSQAQPPPQQPPPQQMGLSIQGTFGAGDLVRDLDTEEDLTYGAILGLHFLGPLSLEFEYQHAENDVNNLPSSATLKQDGVLGHARFDVTPGNPLALFGYAGLGWVRYHSNSSVLDVSDDQLVIPAGVGAEFHFKPLVVGVRGEYQWIPNDVAGSNADYWKVIGTAGFRTP